MSKKVKDLSDEEIDRLVVAQAEDDSAWEELTRVNKSKSSAVPLSARLASQCAARASEQKFREALNLDYFARMSSFMRLRKASRRATGQNTKAKRIFRVSFN